MEWVVTYVYIYTPFKVKHFKFSNKLCVLSAKVLCGVFFSFQFGLSLNISCQRAWREYKNENEKTYIQKNNSVKSFKFVDFSIQKNACVQRKRLCEYIFLFCGSISPRKLSIRLLLFCICAIAYCVWGHTMRAICLFIIQDGCSCAGGGCSISMQTYIYIYIQNSK